jgi:SulP family sulfate permease
VLMLLRRAARPHVAFLGRVPGTRRFSDIERNPDNEPVPGALIFRVESGLLYFNAEHVRDTVRQKLASASTPVRLVVFDLSTSPHVDVTGVMMLSGLQKELAAAGIATRFVEARAGVRDLLRTGDTRTRVGEVDRRISLDDVVRELESAPSESLQP